MVRQRQPDLAQVLIMMGALAPLQEQWVALTTETPDTYFCLLHENNMLFENSSGAIFEKKQCEKGSGNRDENGSKTSTLNPPNGRTNHYLAKCNLRCTLFQY